MSGGRRAGAGFALAVAVSAPCAAQAPTAPLDPDPVRVQRAAAPGLERVHLSALGAAGTAPWDAHLLRVDLARWDVDVALALDQILGQETPSSMARRLAAVAAVNGGFSVSNDPWTLVHGDPNGFLAIDGVVLSEPVAGRPAVWICRAEDGSTTVGGGEVAVRVEVRGPWGALEGAGLNRARGEDDMVVHTPEWGRSTVTDADGFEAVVSAGRVVAAGPGGSSTVPDDGFVVSASGVRATELASTLSPGRRATLGVGVTRVGDGAPVSLAGCDATSAGPVLVDAGMRAPEASRDAYREGFVVERHPRTAIGVTRDGATLLLLVVDGRREGFSAGATLAELAGLLLAEGAWWAYNLDGGGSSVMVLDGQVLNRPSDDRERRRTDALLVRPRR